MARPTRWVTDTKDGHSEWYIERFRKMEADGADLVGEGRLVDAMVRRNARILDAGCGPGRVGAYLHAVGHDVVGVDADPKLIAAAEVDHPGPHWLVADLSELDLTAQGEPDPPLTLAITVPGCRVDVVERALEGGQHRRHRVLFRHFVGKGVGHVAQRRAANRNRCHIGSHGAERTPRQLAARVIELLVQAPQLPA
jgi:SAM-dependent methyltransferase